MKTHSAVWLRILPAAIAALAVAWPAKADPTVIGPLNPGFESAGLDWNASGPGGAAGSDSFDNSPTNGPSETGTNCALMTSDGSVSPPDGNDLRANYFSLGAAARGSNSVTFQFDYNILSPINFGDSVRCDLRFEDAKGNFLAEQLFYIGTPNGDSGGEGWRHFLGVATAVPTAVNADIRLSMNIFGDDIWSDGPVLFDNFSVTVNHGIGPLNPGFENGGLDWNSSGPGGTAGSDSFDNSPTNGTSDFGTNCAQMTSDGSVSAPDGNDLRANYFPLGAATQGSNALSLDFDYNILNPVNFGDQIRVGLRFEDTNGGFLGEHNFYIGTPNNDPGAQGWAHFHGVAVPTFSAVNADIRISMNIFGDDIWSSGPVLYDNFLVAVTPVIGPNDNPGFENGGANWNTGGPGGPAGSVSFFNPSNGWSDLGTNAVLITSDGSLGPTGSGVDLRVNAYSLANNNHPLTFSWDYNILDAVKSGNEIRVGIRFFDANETFLGEFNTHLGSPNHDLGAQGWKHISVSATPTAGAVNSDIRVSMNVFGTGDDNWSSGPVLFDNFVVITGNKISPVAKNITLGTLEGLPVTRPAIGGAQGATDPDGNTLTVSYLATPAHGTATTDGSNITYLPNGGYAGADSFIFAVSDGLGGLAKATATAQVNSGPGANMFVGSTNAGANSYVLAFSGAPDCDYVLQWTASLAPPIVWTPLLTNAGNASGSVTFTNQQAGLAGFWRTILLP